MRLYIIRHGETDWNLNRLVQGSTDIPLNEYGRYLARETIKGFKDVQIDLAFTSPLQRARETAEIVLSEKRCEIIDEPRIREICFGEYEGVCCSGPDRAPESAGFGKFFKNTENYIPLGSGETAKQVLDRAGEFLEEIYRDPELQDKNILISTHGVTMTALINCIKNNLEIKHFWREEVPSNCGVTIVEVKNGVPEILQENVVYYSEPVRKWTADE